MTTNHTDQRRAPTVTRPLRGDGECRPTVIPSRESAATKARRYITEGRLTITTVTGTTINAICRGDGETYNLGYTHHRWHCSCPCRTTECCHLIALRLVADRPGPQT